MSPTSLRPAGHLFLVMSQVPIAAGWLPSMHIGRTAPPEDRLLADAHAAMSAPLSRYSGSTADVDSLPRGWLVCRRISRIGHGRADYEHAMQALNDLEFFELGWLTARQEEDVIVVASRQFAVIWLTIANRVLHREPGAITFGTTRRHVLAGEERIEVRWDPATQAVDFEVRKLCHGLTTPPHSCAATASGRSGPSQDRVISSRGSCIPTLSHSNAALAEKRPR